MRILAISGSLRRESFNAKLLRAAEELAPGGVEFSYYDELEDVPPYNEDHDTDDPPVVASRLRARIAGADAILIATPEYNYSVPGQLKTALDWASRPAGTGALAGKHVAVMGASTGMFGAVWAQAEVRKILGAAGARVVEGEVPVGHAHDRFHADGTLRDEEIKDAVASLLSDLVGAVAELRAAA